MKRDSQTNSLHPDPLIWVGPLTVFASIAAVLLVRFTAVAVLHPEPTFLLLTVKPAVIDTTILVSLAVFVFHRIVSGRKLHGMLVGLAGRNFYTLDPLSAYKLVAGRALLLSFVPDIAVAFSLGAKWPYALALAAMHVAAWAVSVPMLTKLAKNSAKLPETESRGDPE
jgi:hypothetical protein